MTFKILNPVQSKHIDYMVNDSCSASTMLKDHVDVQNAMTNLDITLRVARAAVTNVSTTMKEFSTVSEAMRTCQSDFDTDAKHTPEKLKMLTDDLNQVSDSVNFFMEWADKSMNELKLRCGNVLCTVDDTLVKVNASQQKQQN